MGRERRKAAARSLSPFSVALQSDILRRKHVAEVWSLQERTLVKGSVGARRKARKEGGGSVLRRIERLSLRETRVFFDVGCGAYGEIKVHYYRYLQAATFEKLVWPP